MIRINWHQCTVDHSTTLSYVEYGHEIPSIWGILASSGACTGWSRTDNLSDVSCMTIAFLRPVTIVSRTSCTGWRWTARIRTRSGSGTAAGAAVRRAITVAASFSSRGSFLPGRWFGTHPRIVPFVSPLNDDLSCGSITTFGGIIILVLWHPVRR